MKRKSASQSAFFNVRVLLGLLVFCSGVFLALLGFGVFASVEAQPATRAQRINAELNATAVTAALPMVYAKSFNGDVRNLPHVPIKLAQRAIDFEEKLQEPETPIGPENKFTAGSVVSAPITSAPMPAPLITFEGLARLDVVTGGTAGAGFPPDTNGEIGRNHYIQSVNDAYAIYNKTTGALVASFTENSLFSGGPTGTICDTDTFGDPVVVYDQVADRWILTNLAFVANSVTGLWNPPLYECIAASKTSDPVSGGWWLYAVRIDDGTIVPTNTLHDYPKFGSWNDGCLYMGANGFSGSTGSFTGPIFASFKKNDMYNGLPLTSALGRIASTSGANSGLFPSHVLGTQPGQMPPAGTPNYFVNNASTTSFSVRKFTPGPNCGAGGTIGAATTISHTSNSTVSSNIVPQPNDSGSTHNLDSLGDRIMQKVQYRKIGAAESLWVVHTGRPTTNSNTRPQWAQIDVTGTTVNTIPVQQAFHAPDTTIYRWMPSLAVDRDGNMAIAYSTANGTSPNFPSVAYAGRLAADPLNSLPQTETLMTAGLGSQLFDCGSGACHRWGDYSALSIDPVDDCTFWFTTQYYPNQTEGNPAQRNWHTRIGSFRFASCTPSVPAVTSAVSRKTHGIAGDFDIDLPLTGPAGIETRTGGVGGDHQVVVTFASSVTVGGTTVTSSDGNATATSSAINQVVTIDLHNVANVQTLNITLTNVNGAGDVSIPMAILLGDVNVNGQVNATDVALTKSGIGLSVTSSNFRSDVNVNGEINATDAVLVKLNIGTALP